MKLILLIVELLASQSVITQLISKQITSCLLHGNDLKIIVYEMLVRLTTKSCEYRQPSSENPQRFIVVFLSMMSCKLQHD